MAKDDAIEQLLDDLLWDAKKIRDACIEKNMTAVEAGKRLQYIESLADGMISVLRKANPATQT